MTSKERVYHAIKKAPVDKMPKYFWIGAGAAKNLSRALNIDVTEVDAYVGNDIMQPWLSINKQMTLECGEGEEFVDEWGITWKRDGYYNTPVKHPLANMSASEIAAYQLPDPYDPERYADLKYMLATYGKEYFIGADVSGSIFEPSYSLRGMDNLFVDMAMEAEEADILLDKVCEFTTCISIEAVRLGVDWIWMGDDWGSQKSMLMSPEMWRQYFKPRLKRIIDAIHQENPEMIIAYHSCGSISPIIGDLVEIGVNVLNPLQESAADMNHQRIKDEYGDKLTFMCGLDTQTFLVNATPEEVCTEMEKEICKMGKNGGYIAAVSHTIQHDVPAANIIAMLQTVDNCAMQQASNF